MITQELKNDILRDYNNRSMSMRELESKYNITRAKLARIAVEAGAEPRRPKTYGVTRKEGAKIKTCPKCRKQIKVQGAKYCYNCGADIRSAKELLIERINKAFDLIPLLPSSARDEAQQLFNDVIRELKG